jgi:hypothetical protein
MLFINKFIKYHFYHLPIIQGLHPLPQHSQGSGSIGFTGGFN